MQMPRLEMLDMFSAALLSPTNILDNDISKVNLFDACSVLQLPMAIFFGDTGESYLLAHNTLARS